jgi:hypothetical protein
MELIGFIEFLDYGFIGNGKLPVNAYCERDSGGHEDLHNYSTHL